MNKQCYRKSLDLQKNGVQWSVEIKKNDVNSRKIVISLTDGGKTFNLDENMIVTVYAKKPDENIIYSNCKIESGLVIFEPTKQCISAEGTVNCELRIYSENSSGSQLLTSPRFSIEVYGVLSNEEHLVSTNEYSALTEATLKAQEATDKANDVTDEITQKLENGELKGEKGEQGPQGEQGIQGVPGTTDYTSLQNLPRTPCSGVLELTEITNGGYEAIAETSITYNGVEKFKLDKGNLLFLKENTVNIQNGYGCYCIDNIPEEANDDWTKYYGVTEKELQNELKTVNSALNNRQRSFDADNGLSFNRPKTTLSLNNGSTVLKKSDMLTAITASGRYDVAESGDMLIGFPGVTDFTPFTLKVVKGDIVKILFDTTKNVTDILYIGDISPNMTEKEIASTKKYIKNPLFDMTIFELNVDSEQKCYKENSIMESLYINPFTDIYDLICRVDNIPSGSIGLIMATSKKDEFGNYLYRKVSLASGLTMETSATTTRLKVLPAQLNLSESNITYEHEGTNDETLKAFAENVYSYIDNLQAQIDELKKAVGTQQTAEQSEVTEK